MEGMLGRLTRTASCHNPGKNRSGSTESLYWREFSQARQKIYLTSVKSPSHQTVKVFLLKSKLEPKVDALCCWTQTFHGISGIVLSPRHKGRTVYLQYTIYDLFYTGVLFFLWKLLHLFFILTCNYNQGLTPIGHWWVSNYPTLWWCLVQSKIKIWRNLNNLTPINWIWTTDNDKGISVLFSEEIKSCFNVGFSLK